MFNGILSEGPFVDVQGPMNGRIREFLVLSVNLLKNARAADILHLVHFENLRKQVLVLSPESRSVSEVGASEVVPWPVIWSLARYHRCHVWYTGTRPRMEALVHDFQQFAAKVRWKWHFREEHRGFYIHLKNSRYIPPYPLVTPPELEGWLSLLRERMLMTARTTLHNPRLQQSRSNVLPLTKHGWKCLKTSCWVAFLNDKDGGFTLVHEDHVPQAHMEVLNSRWYREVFPEMYRGDVVAKQYKNLCANVERVMGEGDGVARNLFRSFVRRGAASIAKLDLTVKSHKGPGFATFRNIHSLACYSLEGLSQWAARELRF